MLRRPAQGNSASELARTKDEYDAFLADRGNLDRVAAAEGAADEEQGKVLRVLRRTFATYVAEDERVSAVKARARPRLPRRDTCVCQHWVLCLLCLCNGLIMGVSSWCG
jgi:hypothetical protein